MKKFTLMAVLMLACGAASAQTTTVGNSSWLGGEGSIAGSGELRFGDYHTTIGSNVWSGGEDAISIGDPAPQPPDWVLVRWTRDIARISAELVTSAEGQCISEQAKQQLQRARLMAESMRNRDRTPLGEFSDATLRMTSVVNNVRLALDACNQ